MSFFSKQDHDLSKEAAADTLNDRAELSDLAGRLAQIHRDLFSQMRSNQLNLYPTTQDASKIIQTSSIAAPDKDGVLTINYWRGQGQGVVVERRMGRQIIAEAVDLHRHPVIELRLAPEHFAVELIISPDAWWDQQNLAGKLSIERHRKTFYDAFQKFDDRYRFGFWSGIHVGEMHLNAEQMRWKQVLDSWISTFSPGKDWFRLGVWYQPEELAAEATQIVPEVLRQIKALYRVYQQLAWTSDNNFVEFYQKTPKNSLI